MSPVLPVPSLFPFTADMVLLVGEGQANAVFSLSRAGRQQMTAEGWPPGELFRLQKAPAHGGPPLISPSELDRYWREEIWPLFSDPDGSLVRQRLFPLPPSLPRACNALLANVDRTGSRRKKFLGDRVWEAESVGMLVEDMRPEPDSLVQMMEFKPKWLAQSPSAPPGSIRCRTCATALRRFVRAPSSAAVNQILDRPCPLRLVEPLSVTDDGFAGLSLAHVVPEAVVVGASAAGRALMLELREAQLRLDPAGPLQADITGADFAKAMTLRDCTCYVYLSLPSVIRCRLGDLDRKPAAAKAAYWRDSEHALVHGGFYTASHLRLGAVLYPAPNICLLADKDEVCTQAASPRLHSVIRLVDAGNIQSTLDQASDPVVVVQDTIELLRQLDEMSASTKSTL